MKLYVAKVKDDAQIEQFIKFKFGSGCKLGAKKPSKISGIYDVEILGDGKDLGTTQCPINFVIKTKYNQPKGEIIIFNLGQDCNLIKNAKYECSDSEVVDSLKFN